MPHARLLELVRQSEAEGVPLAELLSRILSAKELDRLQDQLEEDISEGYESISDFMSDVEVPSIEKILAADQAREAGLA